TVAPINDTADATPGNAFAYGCGCGKATCIGFGLPIIKLPSRHLLAAARGSGRLPPWTPAPGLPQRSPRAGRPPASPPYSATGRPGGVDRPGSPCEPPSSVLTGAVGVDALPLPPRPKLPLRR